MAATRTRTAVIALLAAVSLGLSACTDGGFIGGSAEENSVDGSLSASIDEAVNTALELSGSTAAVVGVWTSSGAYVHGFGEDINASASIRAAQASQPVMCALLLDLVREGHLNLDRLVSDDLPRQVGIEDITYRDLCTATSGLADFKNGISDIFVSNPTRPWTDRELLSQALALSPVSAPGAKQQVSDTGALLLARALPVLMNTSIQNLLEDHVYGPAGMSSSFYPSDVLADTKLPSGGMTGLTYRLEEGEYVCDVDPTPVPQVSPSMLNGAGATVTTVTDLKRFYESYLSGAFSDENTASLVTTPSAPEGQAENKDDDVDAGAGDWTFGLEQQGSLYGLSGEMTGTITAAYHDPADAFTVVVSLNNSSSGAAFARALALQLAAIADADVDWSTEDQAKTLQDLAAC